MDNKENKKTHRIIFERIGFTLITVAFIFLIIRIILESIYGGTVLESTGSYLIILGFISFLIPDIVEKKTKNIIVGIIFILFFSIILFNLI